ncbi:hypothetical protein [Halopolyspora algeriensis]|nr:hypothetical protein [Halopolyspora algeriensis]
MLGDQSALRRGTRRLGRLAGSAWGMTASALLLAAGVLAWMPVDWSAL